MSASHTIPRIRPIRRALGGTAVSLLLCFGLNAAPPESPQIESFEADPQQIYPGDAVKLSWIVSGATRVIIEPEVGDVEVGSGTRSVYPEGTTTYTLRVDNGQSASVVVQVESSPRPLAATPELTLRGTETSEVRGRRFTRYNLTVTNYNAISDALFQRAPELPACGLNANSSRTWVDIYDAATGKRIYGFCALSAPQDLTKIWFAVEQDKTPPRSVYVMLHDRKEGKTYRSNSVRIR